MDRQAALQTLQSRPGSQEQQPVLAQEPSGGSRRGEGGHLTGGGRAPLPPLVHKGGAAPPAVLQNPSPIMLDPRAIELQKEIDRTRSQLARHADRRPTHGGLMGYLASRGATILTMPITAAEVGQLFEVDFGAHGLGAVPEDEALQQAAASAAALAAAAAAAKDPKAKRSSTTTADLPAGIKVDDPRRKWAEERLLSALRTRLKFRLGPPRTLAGEFEPEPKVEVSLQYLNPTAAAAERESRTSSSQQGCTEVAAATAAAPPPATAALDNKPTSPGMARPQSGASQRPGSAAKPQSPAVKSKTDPKGGAKGASAKDAGKKGGKAEEVALPAAEEKRPIVRPTPSLTDRLKALGVSGAAEVAFITIDSKLNADVVRGRAGPIVDKLMTDLVPAVTQAAIR